MPPVRDEMLPPAPLCDAVDNLLSAADEVQRQVLAAWGTRTPASQVEAGEVVTDAMINAGGSAVVKTEHLTGCERAKLIYAAMRGAALAHGKQS